MSPEIEVVTPESFYALSEYKDVRIYTIKSDLRSSFYKLSKFQGAEQLSECDTDFLYCSLRTPPREPRRIRATRFLSVLDGIFANDHNSFISITAHSGTIKDILRLCQRDQHLFPHGPGLILPLTVAYTPLGAVERDGDLGARLFGDVFYKRKSEPPVTRNWLGTTDGMKVEVNGDFQEDEGWVEMLKQCGLRTEEQRKRFAQEKTEEDAKRMLRVLDIHEEAWNLIQQDII
ncbi:hypothetical protein P154DRAFT_592417 [Amniculicola lignicola CBS 123094]|uniref:Phosphoglycerate mutase-like protein n=1 Tax=Amniculicola lignicola CBS 123094 TaxID=1392246 RepID=A0A6A5WZM0_9PLEO|nr:hypothetical protein P154DRAFT_592417 [Amniculicola lignicola CBS 123094]